jgi:hypothetical protein
MNEVFINAVNTITKGVDVVFKLQNLEIELVG